MTAKNSLGLIVEEVRAQYSRQLSNWTDLERTSHTFLQLNGLMLTIILIGIGFVYDAPISVPALIMLLISASCIIASIWIIIYGFRRQTVKETKVELESKVDVEGKEEVIMRLLVAAYNEAQDDVISKHNGRTKVLWRSQVALSVGLAFLFAFILWLTVDFVSASQN